MDEAIVQFTSITGASVTQAEQYLTITDGHVEQAIQLFFEDPSLASSAPLPPPEPAPIQPPSGRGYHEDRHGVIHIDTDDESDNDVQEVTMHDAGHMTGHPDTSADAELARRMQEEMYGGSGGSGTAGGSGFQMEEDDVRAPMARTRETLIGGPEDLDASDYSDAQVSALLEEQLRQRERRRRGGGSYIANVYT
jgi:UBX domain-containing protein 7